MSDKYNKTNLSNEINEFTEAINQCNKNISTINEGLKLKAGK